MQVMALKEGAESPNPCHDLRHRVIEGVRPRSVTTYEVITVPPSQPALRRI